jgi:hypothetical protein
MRTVIVVALALFIAACGGHPPPPKRGVVEGDLGAWRFRRFQPVLDIEVMIAGNRGEGYTASYVADAAERTGHIGDQDVVNVFVTRYDRDDGVVRATVKLARRLAAEQGYQVDEAKIAGARALASYVDRYPSLLPGGALEGPLPPGPDDTAKPEKDQYDPNAPKPDFDKYDPDKTKLPPKKDSQ